MRLRMPLRPDPRLGRRYGVARSVAYAAAATLWLGVVVHLILSFAFVGGQVGSSEEPMWQGLVAWPSVDVPEWSVVGVTLVGVGAALVAAGSAPVEAVAEVDVLTGLAMAFVVVPILVAGAFPAADGPPVPWAEGVRMGWHLVVAPLGVVAMIVLHVRFRTLRRRLVRRIEAQTGPTAA